MNDSVANEALVMPNSTGTKPAGTLPSASRAAFSVSTRARSACSPLRKRLSPTVVISALRNI